MNIEIYKDKKGEFRARFKARNGKIIWVTSESYKRKRDCLHAIRLLLLIPYEVPKGTITDFTNLRNIVTYSVRYEKTNY